MANVRGSKALSFRLRPGNNRCADCMDCDCAKCGFPDPVWISKEFGIIVCDECMSLHDTITSTEFKSILNSQEWTDDDWQVLDNTCNKDVNVIYEAKMPLGYQKPTRCFDRAFREQFLTSKYIKRHFVASTDQPNSKGADVGRRMALTSEVGFPSYLKFGEKTGYLWKSGRDDEMFARRWFEFVVEKSMLIYYTDANKQNQRGEIPLHNVHVCLASEDKIHHPNGLQLIIEEGNNFRMIYLYADKVKDMVEWYQAICIVKFWVKKHAALASGKVVTDEEILRNLNLEVMKEGYMLKTDTTATKAFKKRWFVLHGMTLMYFKNTMSANPLNSVDLGTDSQGCSLIRTGDYQPNWPQGGFHFLLKTPGRIFTFIADSEQERKEWYEVLFRAFKTRSHADHQPPVPLPRPPADHQAPAPLPRPPPEKQPVRTSIGDRPLPVLPPENERHRNSLPASLSPNPPPLRSPSPRRESSPLPQLPPLPPLPRGESDTYMNPKPPVAPRPKPPNHRSNEEDSEDEPDNQTSSTNTWHSDEDYVELETVPIICTKVDAQTCINIAQGYCLRIPQGALELDAQGNQKCFVSVTPLQSGALPEQTQPEQPRKPAINAHGAHIVDCRSFNYRKPLRKPLQLEVPHCAIIGDLDKCTAKFWHKNATDDNAQWREIQQDNNALSCRVKQRCVQITTLHMGSYAFLLDGSGVRGKAMQMAVFSKALPDAETIMAHICLFNNIGSDSVWTDVEDKEYSDGAVLSDVSTSFSVYRDGSDITLTLHDFEDMQLIEDQPSIVTVPGTRMWQSPFIQLKAKFRALAPKGRAKITLRQSYSSGEDWLEVPVTFNYTEDEHAPFYTTVGTLELALREYSLKDQGKPRCHDSSLLAGQDGDADNYMEFQHYPMPTRTASARNEAQRRQTLRRHHVVSLLRSRNAPLSRTTPMRKGHVASKVRSRGRGSGGSTRGGGSASTTASEASSDTSGATSGSSPAASAATVIPEGLKERLSVLLDPTAHYGNDWSMLVKYIGLDHLMHRFIAESQPTITVLDCCGEMEITLTYLETAMRDINREDAAAVIRSFLPTTNDEERKDEEE